MLLVPSLLRSGWSQRPRFALLGWEPLLSAETKHPEDVELCRACLRGEPDALRRLEEGLIAAAEQAMARMALSRDNRAEVVAQVRSQLLVRDGEGMPKLASYAGAGPIGAWLRVVVTRAALNRLRDDPFSRAVPLDEDELLEWPSVAEDPELAQIRKRCGPAFKRAFAEAFAALGDRERLILQQHFVDGLTTGQLARLHAVNAATTWRWVRTGRESLLRLTRERLGAALQLPVDELDSLIALLTSQLEISLARLR
jgi:RNA polymerase sigma-70 factor (ECF subfamily)